MPHNATRYVKLSYAGCDALTGCGPHPSKRLKHAYNQHLHYYSYMYKAIIKKDPIIGKNP